MSERWPYIPDTMAIQPILRIPLNHKGLSIYLSSAKPQGDYSTGGGGWILFSLLCSFANFLSRIGGLVSKKSKYFQGFKCWFLQAQWWPGPYARRI